MVAVLRRDFRLRPMRREDVDAVNAIEQRSYPYPWTRGIFSDCLRIGYCCRVAVHADSVDRDAVHGYAILSVGAGEGHLLNLCVDPDARRAGLGQLLLDGVLMDAKLLRARRLFLEVRPSNHGAIALYQGNGFRIIGRRPGYYPTEHGREDAQVMVRYLEAGDDRAGR